MTSTPKTELLAPAGDWDALRAAVAAGADAVYFGLQNFNARHRATNFSDTELPEVIKYLHDRNVRGYVTINTLVFSNELTDAAATIWDISDAGADAVIVQDLGLTWLIRQLAPELPIHASTQMTLTEPRGIEFARRLGIQRAIVARELSLDDIRAIARQTCMPLEVFVHGALCIAYSGQCLTSEALGGRSANRGQCAQACRLPYELVVDGERRELGDVAYLLSPQDLAAYDLIDELVGAGVCSVKIEGRLKSAQYVAATTQAYRAALDAANQHSPFELSRQGELDLQQSFSRGFSPGFLAGLDHQQLVQGRFPKSRGIRVGTVASITPHSLVIAIDPTHDASILKPGDGVVFDEGHPDQDEQGGRVYAAHRIDMPPHKLAIKIELGRDSVNLAAISRGAIVWKTDDPEFRRRMEHVYSQDKTPQRNPLDFALAGQIGERLQLLATTRDGLEATASWDGPLQTAQKHPVTLDAVREQLDRLGDSPFCLGEVTLQVAPTALVPKSVLNDLRRQVVTAIVEQRDAHDHGRRVDEHALTTLRAELRAQPRVSIPEAPQLYVLARTMEQLMSVLMWRPESPVTPPALVYCDFEDVRRYRDAMALARQLDRPIGLATLRVLKPGEEGLLRQIARQHSDVLLVRNLAGLDFFRHESPQATLVGDFSLNVVNELSAELLRRAGLQRLVTGYDMNWEQLAALVEQSDPGLFEVVIHQHMPMFHMEHCVFAHTLSAGKDWRDCGRPCDHHRVELHDRMGADFPLLADTGCRNTVFNSVAQSAIEYLPRMLKLGLRHFRVELLRENAEQSAQLVERYARVLAGVDEARSSWRGLQVLQQLGVTRGTLQAT